MENINSVPEMYGSLVFNDKVMKERLPKDIYKAVHACATNGTHLQLDVANTVAAVMKNWALEHGATHFTHWFQPMTGLTAEKHDSFINPQADGSVIMDFSGKELVKGEPDASSFPSGGLRATFEARGYTAWDPSSPAFIKDGTLYIPTAFASYGGEALDKKTPLLRSMEALSKEAVKVLHLLGNTEVTHVDTTVGSEQEYFLIMHDLDQELWKLGVPAKTKHNEVAPSQHELAPVFETANIAVDHNQLTMEMMKKVADKHGYACLLHEKPFEGVNGSGKHNNWSIITNTGVNLLDPGKTPDQNIQFLVFLMSTIAAVDEYADLLRVSVATAGNDHRLGANEAPPAVISIFVGDELAKVLKSIDEGTAFVSAGKTSMGLAEVLPHITKDTTDRNRTSPFAFTGNKFEFRMPGSSLSVADPNMVLNTAVAEYLSRIYDALKDVPEESRDEEVKKLLKKLLDEHKKILFNGNGYTDEWIAEAEKRGLYNLKSLPDAMPHLISDKSVDLFTKHGVFTKEELRSRYEIFLENYVKTIHIESLTMQEMVRDIIGTLDEAEGEIDKALGKLSDDTHKAEAETDALKTARYYHDTILTDMDTLRASVDAAEAIIPEQYLPYPTYGELLFSLR